MNLLFSVLKVSLVWNIKQFEILQCDYINKTRRYYTNPKQKYLFSSIKCRRLVVSKIYKNRKFITKNELKLMLKQRNNCLNIGILIKHKVFFRPVNYYQIIFRWQGRKVTATKGNKGQRRKVRQSRFYYMKPNGHTNKKCTSKKNASAVNCQNVSMLTLLVYCNDLFDQ